MTGREVVIEGGCIVTVGESYSAKWEAAAKLYAQAIRYADYAERRCSESRQEAESARLDYDRAQKELVQAREAFERESK